MKTRNKDINNDAVFMLMAEGITKDIVEINYTLIREGSLSKEDFAKLQRVIQDLTDLADNARLYHHERLCDVVNMQLQCTMIYTLAKGLGS